MLNMFGPILGVLALSLNLVACSYGTYEVKLDKPTQKDKDYEFVATLSDYKIGAEDTISINVWKNPELSVIVPVRPDGKISMPLIGDVKAAGFTPNEVSQKIQNKLKNYVRNPNVTLMITGLQSHEYLTRIRITGAVLTQSSIKYRQGMTVLDAILAAGSVNDFADPNGTKLYRKISEKIIVKEVNLGDILFKGRLENNINLRPGDIITVPERLF